MFLVLRFRSVWFRYGRFWFWRRMLFFRRCWIFLNSGWSRLRVVFIGFCGYSVFFSRYMNGWMRVLFGW